jgi:hypothetical protein
VNQFSSFIERFLQGAAMPSLKFRLPRANFFLLALPLVLSCGGNDDSKAADRTAGNVAADSAPGSAEQGQAQASSANPAVAPLTTADIERWDKGMAGELKAVQEAGAKLKSARTGEDTLTAMMGVQETATMGAGAQAAGLELERYKFVRSNLSAAVSYLTPSQGGIDTTLLSQAQRDEMRQMNEAQIQRMQQDVPAAVVDALKPRAVELRKKDLELVAARLKGAGMQ